MYIFEYDVIRDWEDEYFTKRQEAGWELVNVSNFNGTFGSHYCYWRKVKE